jgi:hypothetical protein
MKLALALLLFAACAAFAESTISPAQPYAWGANIGWVNFRPSAADGVVVGEYVCSGYAWAANVGWIYFGSGAPLNGIRYQNAVAADCGVNAMPAVLQALQPVLPLRGYAWGANVGWIQFESQGDPRVDLQKGGLTGYAWSANVGWINLDDLAGNQVATTSIAMPADSDGDGIPDAWELESSGGLTLLTAAGDRDGDGFSDLAEYYADTDPLNPADCLRITQFSRRLGPPQIFIQWTSVPSRLYVIEARDSMVAGAWTDVGLGSLPAAGPETSFLFPNTAAPNRYFRVRALRPLSP